MDMLTPRIFAVPGVSDAKEGSVYWVPSKSIWISSMYLVAIVGGFFTVGVDTVLLFLSTCAITLCGGHSLGMHRRLIHESYECPRWLEYFLVYLGVLVGLAGPFGLMKTHDMRDWAQRQPKCHSYFGHRESMLKDWWWQIHCDITLENEPRFDPGHKFATDKFYLFMEKTWMLQQIPWILLFWWIGGFSWVVWGVCARIAICVTGHWLVGYFAHNEGQRYWHVAGAAVQGYNVPYLGLITMGECWHNNHHAFSGSAKLGLYPGQSDPGWWVLCALEKIGLVWNIRLPEDLPERPELQSLERPNEIGCCFSRLVK